MKASELTPEGPEKLLRDAFIERKQKNAQYSLRSFARDLGLSPALLSLVLNRKRPLSLKQSHRISALLHLSPSKQKKFIELTLYALSGKEEVTERVRKAISHRNAPLNATNVDTEKFRLISNWYHFAILDLTTTRGFKPDTTWISKRIGISKPETEAAIERLISLGLLKETDGMLQKTSLHFKWDTVRGNAATRAFHRQMIAKANDQLDQTDEEAFSKRSIRGSSLAIDPTRIDEAKEFILKFEQEFCRRFTQGEPEEVYQLNLQFFPLTQNLGKSRNSL